MKSLPFIEGAPPIPSVPQDPSEVLPLNLDAPPVLVDVPPALVDAPPAPSEVVSLAMPLMLLLPPRLHILQLPFPLLHSCFNLNTV
jgi:hypothetical protein